MIFFVKLKKSCKKEQMIRRGEGMMNLSGMISDEVIEAILEIFKQEHPSGVYVVSKMLNGNVLIEEVEEGEQRLYLRPFPKTALTVAQIQTLRSRQGIGKAIFECLGHYAKAMGCTQLVIEQAMTTDILRFAEKEQFVLDPNTGMCLEGRMVGNYVKSL